MAPSRPRTGWGAPPGDGFGAVRVDAVPETPPVAPTPQPQMRPRPQKAGTRPKTRWALMLSLLFVTIFAAGGVAGAQATFSTQVQPGLDQGTAQLASGAVSDAVTTTTAAPTTTTTAAPAPIQAAAAAPVAAPAPTPVATPAPAPAPAPAPVPGPPALPAIGHATTSGCSAALAYMQAYAAPGFALACPGYAEGHQAMTCMGDTPQYPNACPSGPTIAISDACPAAYMNESANSWYLSGQVSTEQAKFGVSYGSIDPFGAC